MYVFVLPADVRFGEVVAELSAGFFFGESALLNDAPRASTCVAGTAVRPPRNDGIYLCYARFYEQHEHCADI